MMLNDTILFVTHNEINKSRYDECITAAENGLIYARSFYLDNMCPDWDAIVAEDYSWVMPVTSNKKWGIKYLYQPSFIQQLGVFYLPGIAVPIQSIISFLKTNYSFWEVNFNYSLQVEWESKKFTINEGTNFILHLNKTYLNLCSNYHKDLVKNLKRSKKLNLTYRNGSYINAINQYNLHYQDRIKISATDASNFYKVCTIANDKEMIICREVVNEQDQLLAIVLLLSDGKRLYNIMNTTTTIGRKAEANHFLLNAVINEFSERNLILDFEGSDLAGVKAFYKNFGAVNQPYYKVKYNNLAWPFRLFK